jgi:hypothetical protein
MKGLERKGKGDAREVEVKHLNGYEVGVCGALKVHASQYFGVHHRFRDKKHGTHEPDINEC